MIETLNRKILNIKKISNDFSVKLYSCRKYLFLIIFLFAQSSLMAQFDTEFWFSAPEVSIGHGDRPILLRITSASQSSDVTISQPANPGFLPINISLLPNTSVTVDLTTWIDIIENKPADQVLNYGLFITATEPVTIYYESSSNNNPEIFALKGKNALGKEFFVPMQNYLNNMTNYMPLPYASFDIIATDDNTIVTIVPTTDLEGHPAGIPFNVTLQKGQTYSAKSASHFGVNKPSGTYVTSNKNIAITVKDDTMNGLPFGSCADLGGDQIIPVRMLGMKYIVVPGFLYSPYDQAFIVATQNNTSVSIDGMLVSILNAGETYKHNLNGISASYIETTEPVTVLQLSGFGCEIGASVLPSIECSGSSSVTFTRSTSHPLYITLLVKQGGEGNFLLNGTPGIITPASFTDVPSTGGLWKYAQIEFDLSLIPSGVAQTISNTSSLFHLGMIHGTSTHGCRFGYFSDYAKYHVNIMDANTEFCEGDTLSLISTEILDATYFWTGPGGYYANTREMTLEGLTTLSEGYYFVSGMVDECVIEPDSVYVIVHPDYTSVTDTIICDGDVMTWRGNDFSLAGMYTDSFFTQFGCDSTFVLNLSVNPITSDTVILTECVPYTWPENGQTYTTSGIYAHVTNCHTRYLVLTAIQSTNNTTVLSVCDSYTWPENGQTYLNSGMYETVQGCHTEYLNLTVNPSVVNTTDTIVCDAFYWEITDHLYTASGVYTDVMGCVTEILNLTVIPSTSNTTTLSVCDAYTWSINGQTYTTTGVYSEISGCHTEILDLTVTSSSTNTNVVSACDNYIWPYNNQTYTMSGIYTEVNGCHTEILDLTVNLSEYYLTEADVCEGDVFTWMGNNYIATGTYFFYAYNLDSCLITNELHLTVHPAYDTTTAVSVCDNQLPFIWEGLQLTTSGIYEVTYETSCIFPCDSILRLNLTVNPTYEFLTSDEICDGDFLFWRGRTYVSSGTFYDSLLTAQGCDSIYVLNLMVHPEYEFLTDAEICQGSVYSWRGLNYDVSGMYTDSLQTIHGCDSVYVLNLTVHPVYEFITDAEICYGDIYQWRGNDYDSSGTYYDSLMTAHGCDSVYVLNLIVHPEHEFIADAEICAGDSYSWRGQSYTASGTYYDSLQTIYGCDSVYVLNLIVYPEHEFVTDAEICQGSVYSWRGLNYDVSGMYTDSLQTIHGCDSVYVLNLTVHPVYEFITDAEICYGDIYQWRGNDYDSSGTYYDSLMTAHGCDSVYVLNLIVHPEHEFIADAEICAGDSYSWRGQSYTASGTYYDSLQTIYGCDSVYVLNLMVHPEYEFVTSVTICEGDVFAWRGNNYSTGGVYVDSLQGVFGCDSIYVLNLSVNPSYEFTIYEEICGGDTFSWNGNIYDSTGTYIANYQTITGCDSIYILNLIVHQSYEFIENAEICQGDNYNWKSDDYSVSGIYYDSLQTIQGCDSVYVLNLTVNPSHLFETYISICEGDQYFWRGNVYTTSGVYTDSLVSDNLCDSVYVLDLSVHPVYEFVTDAEICEGEKYTWKGSTYSVSGTYELNFYTLHNCDSTYILNLTVHQSPKAGFYVSDNIVYEDNATIYFYDESQGVNTWNWDFGTGNQLDYSQSKDPIFTFPGAGEYNVILYVQNNLGCIDTASAHILVRPLVTIYVPNAFSPNGDGINDEFYPFGQNISPVNYRMSIFDRWGKLVFSCNDINIPWDGRVMGSNEKAPLGIYTWIIEYSDNEGFDNYQYRETGIVTLIQ